MAGVTGILCNFELIMKRLLFGSLLLWSAGIFAQQPMDLRTCVETAVANNLQIRQGAANVAANEFAVQQSRLSLLPNLRQLFLEFRSWYRLCDQHLCSPEF